MKVALIGYGKMGQLIDEVARAKGYEVVACVRSDQNDWDKVPDADICFEFTRPELALSHIRRCAALKKNVVVGTTGWDESELGALAQEIGILYAPNFSIGVFLWLQMVRHSAVLMNAFEDYDVTAMEWHHKQKRDAPSGTAKWMAATVEEAMERVGKLEVTSVRRGMLHGTHSLTYDSPIDTITITHEARSRLGMAKGAVRAAEWLVGKTGLYTLEDIWKGASQL
jgi:4-hydroxy-tetrahydrodipicolinate reductase